jgi:hypothetical protein
MTRVQALKAKRHAATKEACGRIEALLRPYGEYIWGAEVESIRYEHALAKGSIFVGVGYSTDVRPRDVDPTPEDLQACYEAVLPLCKARKYEAEEKLAGLDAQTNLFLAEMEKIPR